MHRLLGAIEVAPYSLEAKVPLNSLSTAIVRSGVLFRVTFGDGTVGYADCHPWVELGDLPLKQQLVLLKEGQTTPLTAQSLHFAKLDAKARSEKRNLFHSLEIPASHVIISHANELEERVAQGFRYFKLKLGKHFFKDILRLQEIVKILPSNSKLRLDYNNTLTYFSFRQVVRSLESILPYIDFCEDPFPFDPQKWEMIQYDYPVSLAADAHSDQVIGNLKASRFLVCKPAVQSENLYLNLAQKLIITTYMDHPLGQLAAAYIAAKREGGAYSCGVLTHLLYQTNSFSEQLACKRDVLLPPQGYGFGFDELLHNQPWQPL